jgi:hypothetical protein
MIAAVLLAAALALPVAQYDAVIPTLDAWPFATSASTTYSLARDATLFDAPGGTAVATLPAKNFLGETTVVVGVDRVGDWVRVLTPARKGLPSAGETVAQTSAWVARAELAHPAELVARVVISVAAKTLTIVSATGTTTFTVGVGTPQDPTPTGVTGYLQARYFDATQQQSSHPVQLTSLHSTAADEPFGGSDGGLIGLHYEKDATGAVSHGCVRLGTAAVAAVNVLPLGTLVTITP